jgi:hypothetical protein
MMHRFIALLTSLAAVFLVGVASAANPQDGANPLSSDVTGTVIETIDVGAYTYVHVDAAGEKVWAAGPHTELQAGDVVSFSPAMPMPNYHSKTLDRTFDVVYFVARLQTPGAGQETPPPHPPIRQADVPLTIDVSGLAKAEGGKTIREILSDKDQLAGQEVAVRGKVTKFTAKVMGKNWIHLRDATIDPAGAEDLIITTTDEAEIGTTLLVRGEISVNRDFGFGYSYELLIEDAGIAVE